MRIRFLTLLVVIASSTGAWGQFVPGPNPITGAVGAQALSAGIGTVDPGGIISSSGSTVALAMTGTSTLFNNGTIQQTGTGRAIDSNSGIANLTVTNTGLISSVTTDAFRVNTNSAVSLTNSGTIQVSNGGQAIDWAAITTASNQLNNQAAGVITSVGEDAVRPGTNGVVINAGTITATPTISGGAASGSDGVDVRTFTGIQVTNTGSISGRAGIATDGSNGPTSAITINNNTGGTIAGVNGSGLNIDGVSATVTANVTNQFGATIRGGALAGTTAADGDGIDVDGVLTLNNSGDVLGFGAKGANNPEGIAAGGGSITNTATGRIIGSGRAADAPNGDPTKTGNGILIDDSSGGDAIAATTITNSGLIEGRDGTAIALISGGSGLGGNVRTFNNTIINNAGGIIQVVGVGTGAAVRTGNGNDSITNRGMISSGSNGLAIDMQGGNDLLRIEGGVASISGNVDGGTGTNTFELAPGVGNTFSYAGAISNFNLVHVQSGSVIFAGANTYTGTTRISGGVLTLNGAGRLAASSALQLDGGTLKVSNANVAEGQVFASLALTASSTIDLDFNTSLTFSALTSVSGGASLAIENYNPAISPDYAIRFVNDLTNDPTFLALAGATTINGIPAEFNFDGGFTNLTAVPEPGALLLTAAGAAGGFWAIRRRRAAQAELHRADL